LVEYRKQTFEYSHAECYVARKAFNRFYPQISLISYSGLNTNTSNWCSSGGRSGYGSFFRSLLSPNFLELFWNG